MNRVACSSGPAASTSSGPAAARDAGGTLQAAAVRQIDGLVDGLVCRVPLELVREGGAQDLADLLRTPPPVQTLLDELLQLRVTPYLALLRVGATYGRPALSLEGVVLARARVAVVPHIPADRGRTPGRSRAAREDRAALKDVLARCPELDTAAGHVRSLGEILTGRLGATLPTLDRRRRCQPTGPASPASYSTC
jgi:hypothetical protein